MATRSIRSNFEIPMRSHDVLLKEITDKEFIQLIVKPLKPNRRIRAARQIEIYLLKISSHPEMRSEYIKKIIELVKYEKERV